MKTLMMSPMLFAAVVTGVFAFGAQAKTSAPSGRTDGWPAVTRETKPWVYNWWPGSAVDADGLEEQCRELSEKGFGGFHVIPIYGARGSEKNWKPLLSPEWIEAWNLAVRTARRYGLGVDLSMGSGWGFGGPWVGEQDAASSRIRVKRAGPGGEGYMIDPFSPTAMSNHITRFEAAFGRGGTAERPRAFYHDSYEYAGARPKTEGDAAEQLRRTFGVWTDWCRANGYLSRNEAHGAPVNWLDLYALADIPETEMFGKDCRDPLVSKFASSAARLAGRRLVSAEACTWIDEHFHERPAEIKEVIDLLFLSGVNHVFYHGFCYSPTNAVWPGWCFYASLEMNPRNPIWREIAALNAYITRCQSVFQAWTPDNDLLVLFDRPYDGAQMTVHNADDWFRSSETGRTARRLWDEGYQFDFVSPRQLAANPALSNRLDVARARRSPFGGVKGLRAVRGVLDGEELHFLVNVGNETLYLTGTTGDVTVRDPLDGRICAVATWPLPPKHSVFVSGEAKVCRGNEINIAIFPMLTPAYIDFLRNGPWRVAAVCGGPTLPPPTNLTELVGWERWAPSFAGTMRYEVTFDTDGWSPAMRRAQELDLGEVHEMAHVWLNGKDLGVRFMPPYRFDVPEGLMKSGENRLAVEVTSLGANRLRWNDRNGVEWKIFTDINMVGSDYRPLDASNDALVPCGLVIRRSSFNVRH